MKKSIFAFSIFLSALLTCVPRVTFAFDLTNTTFQGVICYIISLLQIVNPILYFLAFLLFFWGLSKFVINSSAKELQTGKNYMMWGVLALFVIVSFQAIIGVLTNEFGFGNGPKSGYPFLPGTVGQSVCGETTQQFKVDSSIKFETTDIPQ